MRRKSGYRILHQHGWAAPKNKRSYIALSGKKFKTKSDAKKWAKANLVAYSGRTREYRYVPSGKVGKTKSKKLFYIKK